MFNFVRISDGGPARVQGPRSEVDVIASVAHQVLGKSSRIDWQALQKHCEVRKLIAEVVPGYQKIKDIETTKAEFTVEARLIRTTSFNTVSHKAQFKVHSVPPLPGDAQQLRLMTVRSEGQFNTVVYEEEDIYRGQDRRDVILLNAADITRLGLHVDQRVTVRSDVGAMHGILVRAFDIRAGNALMYFPEANVLVPKTIDPQSRTPGFKSVLITVQAETAASATEEPANRVPLDVVP